MPKTPWNKVPIKKNLLNNLYIEKGLSIGSIAKILKVSNNIIHNRLREFGINVRSISEAKEIFRISKEKLNDLYFDKKWSMGQIAKHFGCSHGTIVYRFRKYGLKSRGHLGLRRPVMIDKNQLERLYHGQSLSLEQIAKRLHCSKGAIERKTRKFNIKLRGNDHRKHWRYEKKSFDGNPEEKAYLIGFRLGDLNIFQTNQVIVVRGSTTKTAQATLFERLFTNYGGVKTTRAKRGTIEQYAYLNHSFDFLLPKQDKIEQWICECPRCFLAFFAGYFDAEGCAHLHKGYRSQTPDGRLEIQSYDKHILLHSWKNLSKLGIQCKRPVISKAAGYIGSNGVRHNGDSWRLSIWTKASVWHLLHLLEIDMKHTNKLNRLKNIKQNIVERNIRKRGNAVVLDLSTPPIPLHSHIAHIGT
jgi:predicted DNA-binding protein YlxM (UPF0122 family)